MTIIYIAIVELQVPGAPSVHVRGLTAAMASLGHEVHLVVPRSPPALHPPGVNVHGVPFKGFSPARLAGYSVLEAAVIVRLAHMTRPHFVIEREYAGRVLPTRICRLLRLSRIVEMNGWFASDPKFQRLSKWRRAAIIRQQRRSYQWATGLTATMPGELAEARILAGIPKEKTEQIHLGVDPDRFTWVVPAPIREEFRIPSSDVLAVYCGQVSNLWDLETIVRAVALARQSVPSLRLLIVGDGDQVPRLRKITCGLNIQHAVIFAGRRPNDQVPAILAACDIGIVTLHPFWIRARGGAHGTKLLEYFAAGLPVLITDLPDVPLDDQFAACAVSATAGDPQAVAAALVCLAQKSEMRYKLGRAGRELVMKRYTWVEIARQTVHFASCLLEAGNL